MIFQTAVEGDDDVLKASIAGLAQRPRDLEGDRILANLRSDLARADVPSPRIGRFEIIELPTQPVAFLGLRIDDHRVLAGRQRR